MTEVARTRPPVDPDDFELADVRKLKTWAAFVGHSVLRRKGVALTTLLMGLGLTAVALAVWPRTYEVEAQLLAQRNTIMPALGNPGRAIPWDADTPTRAAAETILRRDNLLSLMKQTDLLARWQAGRPWVLKVRDAAMALVFGQPSEEERTDAMAGLLEKRLRVWTSESTIGIVVGWSDPQMAYRLVDTALQNFLEQRHAAEVSSIAEAISILEGHAANLQEAIDASMEDLRKASDRSTRPTSDTGSIFRRDPAQEALRAEAAGVKVMLDAKRKAISELEDFRRRRLAELQAELAQQRAIYAEAHPAVTKIRQSITALEQDSPQLAALRKDERDLLADFTRISGTRAESMLPPAPRGDGARKKASVADDLANDYARTRLRFALEKYDALVERINGARIELDTARAAFKYRYSIVRPATLPRGAVQPRVHKVALAGAIASMFLAVFLAALADLRSGRILESWQIEDNLRLAVLGEVPRA